MSAAACLIFYREKQAQAAKVFADRYRDSVAAAEVGAIVWAEGMRPDLHGKLKAAERELEQLWLNGAFGDDFKEQVLVYFRTLLDICRLYDLELRQKEAA